MLFVSILLFVEFIVYSSVNSSMIDLGKTIEYYINTTKESFDLTIFDRLSSKNCSQSFLTLLDLISFCSSVVQNTTILFESVTTLRLINLCPEIDIKTIEKLKSIRRFIFDNCTSHFLASQQRKDYDYYPQNLSRWIFNHGRTNTFNQFITMVNHLGPLKFDLQLSNCFQPILSFHDFLPLHTQLISLNITCQQFQIDEPSDIKTRTAIFLTPTLIINTQTQLCPMINKYRWLNLKRSQTKIFSLRTLTCENRLVQLQMDIDPITIRTTIIDLTTPISFTSSTISNRWTKPILINFSVIFLSISMLFIALLAVLIRFLTNKSTI